MKTIAVIDDDVYIGDMLEEALTRAGYAIIRAYSGSEAKLVLERSRPDLALLDLMLPGLSGEDILPIFKGIPVIIVSAKTEPSGKAELLRAGAADYITKPFDLDELIARIEVQFRRSADGGQIINAGNLRLDPISMSVTANGEPVKLTKTEFAILKLLMFNRGRVMAKSAILDDIAIDTPDCVESSLKVHIANLRRKLKAADGVDHIEAVWGIGFRFTES